MHKTLFPPLPQHEASGSAEPPTQQRLLSSVGQDKSTTKRERIASPQPVSLTNTARSHATGTNAARAHKPFTKRKTVPLMLWVTPSLKADIQRLAEMENLSLSKVGGALLDAAVRQSIHQHYAAIIQPIIEKTMVRQMNVMVTKLTWLLVRIGFDIGQIRGLVTNLLGRQPGMTEEALDTILDGSSKSAQNNILRRTPQIAGLIEAVEQWMLKEEKPNVNG